MAQTVIQHIFANKPFYKWLSRCSECDTTPMVKCRICQSYNHRRCKADNVERTGSAKRGNAAATLEPQTTSLIGLWLSQLDDVSSVSSHGDGVETVPDQVHPRTSTGGEMQRSSADYLRTAQVVGRTRSTPKRFGRTTDFSCTRPIVLCSSD
uniref:Phorbol-ester/DAG-type domain-containing protein n=1 Tax=Sipha flava TaxID=143950 RepID=A0A2S2QY87_9HEMI